MGKFIKLINLWNGKGRVKALMDGGVEF